MIRRLFIACAALAAGVLVVWLVQSRRTERLPEEETSTDVRETDVPAATPGPSSNPQTSAREVVDPVRSDEESRGEAQPGATDSGAVLVVRAVDEDDGAPLAGVRMTVTLPPAVAPAISAYVSGAKGTVDTSPVTGKDGLVEFELPVGVELRLSASGEDGDAGHGSGEIPALTAGERREIVVSLPTGNDLLYFGKLLAREDRRAIAGARIDLVVAGRRLSCRWNQGEVSVEHDEELLSRESTDSDGLFHLALPAWKEPDIRIQAAGFGSVFLEPGRGHDTPETARVVLLSRGATLHARLLDAGGAAVPDGGVSLWTESYQIGISHNEGIYLPSASEMRWESTADVSGLCVLEDLPPDVALHVVIFREGEERVDLPSLSLSPGELREVEWIFGSGCDIVGSVVDQDGDVVGDQTIWLQRADFDAPRFFQTYHSGDVVLDSRTDAQGRFAFDDVSQGRWWIGPASERNDWDAPDPGGIAPVAQVVEVEEGSMRQEVTLRVHRGLYIRGIVLDPAGEPAETFVHGECEEVGWPLSVESGRDGTFALGPLVPGRYTLAAHGWTQADSEPVEAQGGDEGVVLRLRAAGSLTGTVIDGATGNACAASLTCASVGDSAGFLSTSTDEDGEFRLEGLLPGMYDLVAAAGARRIGVLRGLSVRAGAATNGLVLAVEPGALLRLRYAGKTGYLHYTIYSEETTIAADGVRAGRRSEIVVPAGPVRVQCQWPGGSETRELELALGEEQEVTFGGDG